MAANAGPTGARQRATPASNRQRNSEMTKPRTKRALTPSNAPHSQTRCRAFSSATPQRRQTRWP
eukprot:11168720-Lingulodinium_polyedra.AAC.1